MICTQCRGDRSYVPDHAKWWCARCQTYSDGPPPPANPAPQSTGTIGVPPSLVTASTPSKPAVGRGVLTLVGIVVVFFTVIAVWAQSHKDSKQPTVAEQRRKINHVKKPRRPATCETASGYAAKIMHRELRAAGTPGVRSVNEMMRDYHQQCQRQLWSQRVMDCFADIDDSYEVEICIKQQEEEVPLVQARVRLATELSHRVRKGGATGTLKSIGPSASVLEITADWCDQQSLDMLTTELDMGGWDLVKCVGATDTYVTKP